MSSKNGPSNFHWIVGVMFGESERWRIERWGSVFLRQRVCIPACIGFSSHHWTVISLSFTFSLFAVQRKKQGLLKKPTWRSVKSYRLLGPRRQCHADVRISPLSWLDDQELGIINYHCIMTSSLCLNQSLRPTSLRCLAQTNDKKNVPRCLKVRNLWSHARSMNIFVHPQET